LKRDVICALGTPSGKASSRKAFREGGLCFAGGVCDAGSSTGSRDIRLVSAIGADVNSSFFYPKTKGEVEKDIKLVGFKSLTILRPRAKPMPRKVVRKEGGIFERDPRSAVG
jgi:uncharacterized protein YbjT (DUF2867 family)